MLVLYCFCVATEFSVNKDLYIIFDTLCGNPVVRRSVNHQILRVALYAVPMSCLSSEGLIMKSAASGTDNNSKTLLLWDAATVTSETVIEHFPLQTPAPHREHLPHDYGLSSE